MLADWSSTTRGYPSFVRVMSIALLDDDTSTRDGSQYALACIGVNKRLCAVSLFSGELQQVAFMPLAEKICKAVVDEGTHNIYGVFFDDLLSSPELRVGPKFDLEILWQHFVWFYSVTDGDLDPSTILQAPIQVNQARLQADKHRRQWEPVQESGGHEGGLLGDDPTKYSEGLGLHGVDNSKRARIVANPKPIANSSIKRRLVRTSSSAAATDDDDVIEEEEKEDIQVKSTLKKNCRSIEDDPEPSFPTPSPKFVVGFSNGDPDVSFELTDIDIAAFRTGKADLSNNLLRPLVSDNIHERR